MDLSKIKNSKEEDFQKEIKSQILTKLPKETLLALIFDLEDDKKSLQEKIERLEEKSLKVIECYERYDSGFFDMIREIKVLKEELSL